MQVLLDLSTALPESNPTANAAISLAVQIMDGIDLKSELSIQAAHKLASAFFHLEEGHIRTHTTVLDAFPHSLAHSKPMLGRYHLQHEVYAVGHCHIDTAWLWPYRETRYQNLSMYQCMYLCFCMYVM